MLRLKVCQHKVINCTHAKSLQVIKSGFNPIQDEDGGAAKQPPSHTIFSPVTSTNVVISPQKILTFSFNSFATLV